MAKNKKPKFLEKETPELVKMLNEILAGVEDEDTAEYLSKAVKIGQELEARLSKEKEGPASVEEALKVAAASMTECLNLIKDAYETEVANVLGDNPNEDEDPDEEEDQDEDEDSGDDQEEAPKKSKKSKKSKKGKKEPKEEEDSDDEDEEDEETQKNTGDYNSWSLKDLKKEMRARGIKVPKGMPKTDMVKALKADDKE